MLQEAMVQSIDASAQRFSLNIVGCGSITSTVCGRLSEYLEGVFPGKRITITCVAGRSHKLQHSTYFMYVVSSITFG